MRTGAVDVFRRARSISRTARGGRTFAVTVRMSDALEHDVARGGPLWAEAPVQGTSASSRTVAVNARRVGRTPRPPALISSMIVLPTVAGYEEGAQPQTEPGRQRERRNPQRRPGRTDT